MGELNPGKAPTVTPTTTPQNMRKKLKGSARRRRPVITGSMDISYGRNRARMPGSK
jgi:hypothetical protein